MTTTRPATRILLTLWPLLALAVLAEGYRQAIFISPAEATMGDIFRIFFYHVPNASLALLPPYVNLAGALGFLYFRHRNRHARLRTTPLPSPAPNSRWC